MRSWTLIALLLCSSVAAAGEGKDPYPGSGGMFLGTPSHEDVQSGRAVYTPERIASLKVGVTTKHQVVELLGKPANWSSETDGTSQLGYDFVAAEGMFGMRQVVRLSLSFNEHMVLTEIEAPESRQ